MAVPSPGSLPRTGGFLQTAFFGGRRDSRAAHRRTKRRICLFSVRRCEPVPERRMHVRQLARRRKNVSQDGGQTFCGKTGGAAVGLRLGQKAKSGAAARAKRAVLANGAAHALKSDGFFAKCIVLHPLRFQSPRRLAGPQPPLYTRSFASVYLLPYPKTDTEAQKSAARKGTALSPFVRPKRSKYIFFVAKAKKDLTISLNKYNKKQRFYHF